MQKEKSDSLGAILKVLYEFFKPDNEFFITSVIYGVVVSILSLAIPIAVQSIVNTLAMTALYQQLVVLSLIVLVLLLSSAVFKALQVYVIEKFQRYFYARTVSQMSDQIYHAQFSKLEKRNGQELVNRYFDIISVQKGGATLAVEGIDVILQLFVGVIILAVYHPFFLFFDFVLLISLVLAWRLFGLDAVASAIKQSKAKYRVAYWVEEVAKNNFFLKRSHMRPYMVKRTDSFIEEYLFYRKKHFKNLFSQIIFFLLLYAILSALLLGLGGWLVMDRQLSLGQLVAAELIMALILASIVKSGKILETFYDTFAGVLKIKEVTDFPREEKREFFPETGEGSLIEFENISLGYIKGLSLKIKQNQTLQIVAPSRSLLKNFTHLIANLDTPDKGVAFYRGTNMQDLDCYRLRDRVFVIDHPSFFEDTIENNLLVGKKDPSKVNLYKLLKEFDLESLPEARELGLKEIVQYSGYPLLSSEQIRLDFIRAVIHEPELIMLNTTTITLSTKEINTYVEKIKQYVPDVTILIVTDREDRLLSCEGEVLHIGQENTGE